MYQPAWDEIEAIYSLPWVDPNTVKQFQAFKNSQSTHTKNAGNPKHYCAFFLPFDRQAQKIYLGHHIKAADWIPPGGHIESDETPSQTVTREMGEELKFHPTEKLLKPWNLSVKPINRPNSGCLTHYDVWYLVNLPVQSFDFLRSEYYAAAWFSVQDGIAKITHNPDYAAIIQRLL